MERLTSANSFNRLASWQSRGIQPALELRAGICFHNIRRVDSDIQADEETSIVRFEPRF